MNLSNRFRIVAAQLLVGAMVGCGGGGGTTPIVVPPQPPTPQFSISADPAMTVHTSTTFYVTVKAIESGTTAPVSITLGPLPAGLTTTSTFPMSVPAAGSVIDITVAANAAAGSYQIVVNGTAGSLTSQATIPVTVTSEQLYPVWFMTPFWSYYGLTRGNTLTFDAGVSPGVAYGIDLEVKGLPAGVTGKITPAKVQAGQSFSVSLTAANDAQLIQNQQVTVVGTPAANLPPIAFNVYLTVTASASNAGWTSRTDFLSTRATPTGAVYDPVHDLIFAPNQQWAHIDVISNATHSIIRQIPLLDPLGVDLSIDQKTVWVATGSQIVYGLDTSTLKMTRYQLPQMKWSSSIVAERWAGYGVYSLADGTVLLTAIQDSVGIMHAVVWDPATNAMTEVLPGAGGPFGRARWSMVTKSADGKHIFSISGDSDGESFTYDVLTKTVSPAVELAGYAQSAVANPDGTLIAIDDIGGFNLYDGNLNWISQLPGGGGSQWTPSLGHFFHGGVLFSPDGKTLYEELLLDSPMIATIDVASMSLIRLSPAMPVIPLLVELSPPYFLPVPFAIDRTGMLLGLQFQGIAFEDSLASVDPGFAHLKTPTFMQHASVYSGPLKGGTTVAGFGNVFNLVPDVYFGNNKGTATLIPTANFLQITSPSASAPGPVHVRMLFPNGTEVFNPLFFTYGATILDAVISGAPPEGGVQGKLHGFGLPHSDIQFSHEQTAGFYTYAVPPGNPGWTDVSAPSADGSGTATLHKGFFYAKSVKDFPTNDSMSALFFDSSRHRVYASAGDHVDVFSLDSNSYLSPIQPPAIGASRQFQGMALTPDKNNLLVANLTDQSIAVVDLTGSNNSYAISVPPAPNPLGCVAGPMFVAVDALGEAVVVNGTTSTTSCGPIGSATLVNLTSKATSLLPAATCHWNFGYVTASNDGSKVAVGGRYMNGLFQIYDPIQRTCSPVLGGTMNGSAGSGDGKVFASGLSFVGPDGNIMGKVSTPGPLYSPDAMQWENTVYSPYGDGALQPAMMNDAGSLYYWANPNWIDVVDVQHGLLRLRFKLPETVTRTTIPMAIDTNGQRVALITDKGLTVVDLGDAPVSIGWLNLTNVNMGMQIQVRGSGFQPGITATLGGAIASVSRIDSSTLMLSVPTVGSGLQDIVVMNPDGMKYTLENAVTVQ